MNSTKFALIKSLCSSDISVKLSITPHTFSTLIVHKHTSLASLLLSLITTGVLYIISCSCVPSNICRVSPFTPAFAPTPLVCWHNCKFCAQVKFEKQLKWPVGSKYKSNKETV